LRVFDRGQTLLHTAPSHPAPITSFAIIPSQSAAAPGTAEEDLLVVTASHDRTAQILRISLDAAQTNSTPLATLHLHDAPIADVASSQDGKRILTAGWDGLIGLWSTNIPESDEVPLDTIAAPERKKRRKVQEGGSVKTKAPSAVLRSHTARVSAVAFSDGGNAVSCGFDSTVRTWDVERGLCSHTIVRMTAPPPPFFFFTCNTTWCSNNLAFALRQSQRSHSLTLHSRRLRTPPSQPLSIAVPRYLTYAPEQALLRL
jgi:ribosome biogenesis protein YTM1